jgi:hypothetical protein
MLIEKNNHLTIILVNKFTGGISKSLTDCKALHC